MLERVPNHPIARLLEIDQCHTARWVPDTPEITFQVQRIIDGDTILAHTSEQPDQRLRLWGIDTPESDQPHGPEATARLQALVPTGKMTKARNMGTDQYDCILVIVGEDNELPVNWTMVFTGNAHHYDHGRSAGNIWLSQTKCGDHRYFSVYLDPVDFGLPHLERNWYWDCPIPGSRYKLTLNR